ncbi:MAG: MASE1 domain-containing protein [Magnetospirillum sp.]|nr:MASE1 domain-containing protein [Magnetospirillum sp.]
MRLIGRLVRLLLESVAVGVAFFLAGQLGIGLNLPDTVGSPFWPPSGIALAAVVLRGWRVVPGIALAAAGLDLANFSPISWLPLVLDMTGAVVEPLTACAIARCLAAEQPLSFQSARGVLAAWIGILIGAALAMALGLAGFLLDGTMPVPNLALSAQTWWIGNMAGAAVVAPLVLAWMRSPAAPAMARRPVEALLLVGVLPLVAGIAHGGDATGAKNAIAALEVIAVPVVLAAAYRFHLHGAVTAVALTAGTSAGVGVYALSAGIDPIQLNHGLMHLQMFIAVLAATSQLIAAEIHRRSDSEARLTTALAQAKEASEAKSLFLAKMSHELRTPLNAILGFSEVIHRRSLGTDAAALEKYHGYAGDIFFSGHHLLSLINDILDIARIEGKSYRLEEEWLDVDAIVAECVGMVRGRADSAGVDIRRDGAPGVTRLHADPRALRQIVINLLGNAVKFTPPGGQVAVRVFRDEGGIAVTVRDTGSGIGADAARDLFKPFHRGPSDHSATNREGVGLGLAICRSLLDLHQGTIALDSVPGAGTTVTVRFPPARTAAPPPG